MDINNKLFKLATDIVKSKQNTDFVNIDDVVNYLIEHGDDLEKLLYGDELRKELIKERIKYHEECLTKLYKAIAN
jgi:hypothetical protein